MSPHENSFRFHILMGVPSLGEGPLKEFLGLPLEGRSALMELRQQREFLCLPVTVEHSNSSGVTSVTAPTTPLPQSRAVSSATHTAGACLISSQPRSTACSTITHQSRQRSLMAQEEQQLAQQPASWAPRPPTLSGCRQARGRAHSKSKPLWLQLASPAQSLPWS